MIESKYRGAGWLFLAASFYASAALLGKWLHLLQIPIIKVFSWRYAISASIFWLLLYFHPPFQIPLKSKLRCLCLGLFGDTLRTTLFVLTVAQIGASMASLLLYTFPLFVFMIQRFLFGQQATILQWISLVFSSIGCALAVAPFGEAQFEWTHWLGIVTGIGTGIVQAIYISFSSRFIKGIPTTYFTSYVMGGALITFCIAALCTGQLTLPHTSIEWSFALAWAICATVIPIFCLMKGIALVGANQTSLLLTIEPVITIGLAKYLFEESFTPIKMVGCFLILSSTLFIQNREIAVAVQKEDVS